MLVFINTKVLKQSIEINQSYHSIRLANIGLILLLVTNTYIALFLTVIAVQG